MGEIVERAKNLAGQAAALFERLVQAGREGAAVDFTRRDRRDARAMKRQRRKFGQEPGSLAASDDPAVRGAIRRGRREADADLAAIETWAAGGFASGLPADDRSFVPQDQGERLEWHGEPRRAEP